MDTTNRPFLATVEFPERIGTILRVVDGIAFQKSLLTLHRAVQAASSQEDHHA